MPTLTRLNGDSSWLLEIGGLRLILDPWLVGPEVDGAAFINRQWLSAPALPPTSPTLHDSVHGILVSLPFSDHCHLDTLQALNPATPIFCAPAALGKVRKHFAARPQLGRHVQSISAIAALGAGLTPLGPGVSVVGVLPSLLDPTHAGLCIVSDTDGSVLLLPHGLASTSPHVARLDGLITRPLTLMATCTTYRLPMVLGGTVNLGLAAAKALCDRLQAEVFVDTHSEQKRAEGMISSVATVTYAAREEVERQIPCAVFHALPETR